MESNTAQNSSPRSGLYDNFGQHAAAKSEQAVEVIRKPRTNYSSNVLRRAVPNVNI